ncbi:DUF3322 domain-containing protein [Microbulbifer sp.]|uniref:DUF3322 domain-containing protein n=1 Tax=Microbulbifer sp. TaxID=1908541 RepID=UPI003F2E2F05
MSDWGLLPQQARDILRRREWDNRRHFRQRLTGERPFPIRLPLKPPSPAQALADMAQLQNLVEQWRRWPRQEQVQWGSRQFRHLGAWRLPVALQIDSVQALLDCLGDDALALGHHWQKVMAPLLDLDQSLFPELARHLDALEPMCERDARLLARLLPQLHAGLGRGQYLRALPLVGVDTKFVETWQPLIGELLDKLHRGAITSAGGLLAWLGCRENPKGWLLVRPLCAETRARLGGLPLLQLDGETIAGQPLPAGRILIVENRQSSTGTGLGLPPLDDCIAIFGGGRNLGWMRAPWLADKRVGYWGDIDSWGLTLLGEARVHRPQLQSLMMDVETLERFSQLQVAEPAPQTDCPAGLAPGERALWERLRSEGENIRLEQERLPQDYVRSRLEAWLNSGSGTAPR